MEGYAGCSAAGGRRHGRHFQGATIRLINLGHVNQFFLPEKEYPRFPCSGHLAVCTLPPDPLLCL